MDSNLIPEALCHSCDDALNYPKNLLHPGMYEYALEAYFDRLSVQTPRLFHPEKKALVDFLEFAESGNAFWPETIKDAFELREHLGLLHKRVSKDPRCRFIFIRSTHSREKLKITREMLTIMLSYHQVNPAFLDFIFPFGRQEYPQDFFFSGFRAQQSLSELGTTLQMPDLGRSGRSYEVCFNLKSVERSKYQAEWPWTHRQCAVNHSFDVENGRMLWILVEADPVLKRRVTSATGFRGLPEIRKVENVVESFKSSLETLVIMCEWAAENWRWYLNFVEDKCQGITRSTLSRHVEAPSSPTAEDTGFQTYIGPDAGADLEPASLVPSRRTTSGLTKSSMSALPLLQRTGKEAITQPYCGSPRTGPDHQSDANSRRNKVAPIVVPTGDLEWSPGHNTVHRAQQVSFDDLQQIQFIEETINDVSLILKLNARVVEAVLDHYDPSKGDQVIPSEIIRSCHVSVDRFIRRLQNIKKDLQIQHLRTEAMLRLLAVRKSLAHGIFDVQNTEANQNMVLQGQAMTWQAKQSARNMELMTVDMNEMTQDMNEIAKKTKLETISMRIITLVTLFFLPGTFISTLMSTDIIRFKETSNDRSRSVFQLKALQIYLAISLPLVAITLALSYGFYLWATRGDRRNPKPNHEERAFENSTGGFSRFFPRARRLLPTRFSQKRETFPV